MDDPRYRETKTPWYDTLTLWVLASLLLHFFLFALWVYLPSHWFDLMRPVLVDEQTPTLSWMDEPLAPAIDAENRPKNAAFIQTDESQEVPDAKPNAVLESDHNTRLLSPERGTSRSPLPQQSGDERASLSYRESPRVQPSKSKAQQPVIEEKQQSEASEEKPATRRSQEKPLEHDPLPDEGVPVIPKATPEQAPMKPPTPKAQNSSKEAASPAAPVMSFARERSQIKGSSNSEIGNASPEAKATEMGRYKSKMYRAIGSRWYLMVEQQMGLLAIGSLKVKFFVQANGVIRDIQVISPSGRIEILEKISTRSVRDSGPFEPFSESMKQQMGSGYWEDITFSIY